MSALLPLVSYGYDHEKAVTFTYYIDSPLDNVYIVSPNAANSEREAFTLSPYSDSYTIACKSGDIFHVTDGTNVYSVQIKPDCYDTIYLAPKYYGYNSTKPCTKLDLKSDIKMAPGEKAVEFTSILDFPIGKTKSQSTVYQINATDANPHRESFVISPEQPSHTIVCKVGDTFNVTNGDNFYMVSMPANIYYALYLLPKRYEKDNENLRRSELKQSYCGESRRNSSSVLLDKN